MAIIDRKVKQTKMKRAANEAKATARAVAEEAGDGDHINSTVEKADAMWKDLKERVKADPAFVDLSDDEKIKIYQKEFDKFYTAFPIVSRYMICMGQYSSKAMRRFLKKCDDAIKNMDITKPRDKSDTEDQWVRRQADYVRYLWESYQNIHFSSKEAQAIWQQAYDMLKKEFDDFKMLHDTIEQKMKKEEKVNKTELVHELIKRVADGEQKLDDRSSQVLLNQLKTKAYEQRRQKMIRQLKSDVPLVKPSRVFKGTVEDQMPDPYQVKK
jgi:hypothetical protein